MKRGEDACALRKSAVGQTCPLASFREIEQALPWISHEVLWDCDASSLAFMTLSTEPESRRSSHAKISCRLERSWRGRRVISHDRFQRNSTDKDGRDLSLFSIHQNPGPNNDAQTAGLCENAAGSLVTIRMWPAHARFAFPIRRAGDRCRALCRGCPSLGAKIRLLSKEGRDLSG